MALPPLPILLRQRKVSQAQAGDFQSRHDFGRIIAGCQSPVDPGVVGVTPIARAGIPLSVEPCCFEQNGNRTRRVGELFPPLFYRNART